MGRAHHLAGHMIAIFVNHFVTWDSPAALVALLPLCLGPSLHQVLVECIHLALLYLAIFVASAWKDLLVGSRESNDLLIKIIDVVVRATAMGQ